MNNFIFVTSIFIIGLALANGVPPPKQLPLIPLAPQRAIPQQFRTAREVPTNSMVNPEDEPKEALESSETAYYPYPYYYPYYYGAHYPVVYLG